MVVRCFRVGGKFRRSSFFKAVGGACVQSGGKFRKSSRPGEKGVNRPLALSQVVDKGDKERDNGCE